MATIVTRKGADGVRYQARIRLTRGRTLIHTESDTFLTRAAAKKAWAQKREVELKDLNALAVATSGGTCTLATLIR